MQSDRKVYDSDLALTPLLREIAHQYTREYVGNFDMMIGARQYLMAHGKLDEGMYRPVLNTLRSDPLRLDLWAAVVALRTPASGPYEAPVAPPTGLADVVRIEDARPRYVRRQRPPEPRFKIVVRGHVHIPFATTKSMSHRPVVHLLRRDMMVEWWRHRFEDRELDYTRPMEVFVPHPRMVCSRIQSRPCQTMNFWWEVPTYDLAYPEKWDDGDQPLPFCRACVKAVNDETVQIEPVYEGEVW